MWSLKALTRLDHRVLVVLVCLMSISLVVISSYSVPDSLDPVEEPFFTPMVRVQLQWFLMGWVVFFVSACFDYNRLREWTWLLYLLVLGSLVGLFFTDAIQRVNRWYRVPLIHISFQPSEYAKIGVVWTLSWFLERRRNLASSWSTCFFAVLIVGIPFFLILKQPDLGTALVLLPMSFVMFYFGGVRPSIVKGMAVLGGMLLILVASLFSGLLPYETLRPYATHVLKEYQFERLNPATPHQKAAATAIGLGGWSGVGWRQSSYSGRGWLPYPYTDSVFPAFGEEFGLMGLFFLMGLYYCLIHFGFQVTAVAKDSFGRLLSAGVTVYLAMHILVNIGMMSGLLPITGVPLLLVSYGGSSILSTMLALGILQNIYSQRFMF